MESLIQSKHKTPEADAAGAVETIEDVAENLEESKDTGIPPTAETSLTEVVAQGPSEKPKAPRKLIEDEARRVGRIGKDVWEAYVNSAGGPVYWTLLIFSLILASLDPVAENGWIKYVGALEFLILAYAAQGLVWSRQSRGQ